MTMYEKHDALPAYEPAQWNGDTLLNRDAPVKWGGKDAPPAVGSKIKVTMNNLGPATVKGYFVEEGWLGLLVDFHAPPEWWVKQNGYSKPLGHIFGPEFKAA
jgi:hypothetical protein